MTKIKLYIVLLFLGVGLQQTYSQNYKFKTSGVSVLEKNERGKWGKWSDLQLVNILVSLEVELLFIPKLFNYSKLYSIKQQKKMIRMLYLACKDNNGDDCTLSIITRKQQDNRKQLYINYGNRIILQYF
jgi:hypothetical protein